jgi:hypothetical protein
MLCGMRPLIRLWPSPTVNECVSDNSLQQDNVVLKLMSRKSPCLQFSYLDVATEQRVRGVRGRVVGI